jgi:hypothetical protein
MGGKGNYPYIFLLKSDTRRVFIGYNEKMSSLYRMSGL